MSYLQTTLQPYLEYAPYFLISLLVSFLLTPIVGFIATKLKILDLPAKFRKPSDKTRKTRIKKYIVPRAGGLAIIIPFLLILLVTQELNTQIGAIVIGVIILTISGILDDKYQLPWKYQALAQILASLIIVAAGISIDRVQSPFDTSIDLRTFVLPFHIGTTQYSLALPADIITIIWILMMINAVNWIFGTDSLGEGISIIAFLAILFISVKAQTPLTACIAAIAAGGLLGFIPFNMPPSKITSGTTGTSFYGFLIAVLSILGGVKVASSVIVLIIPIIDMLWVIVGRIQRNGVTRFIEVFRVTTTGDDSHLHHRLFKLGLSPLQVAITEWIGVGICAILAFFVGDLPKATIIVAIGVVVLFIFLGISLLLRIHVKIRKGMESRITRRRQLQKDDTPEDRYAY